MKYSSKGQLLTDLRLQHDRLALILDGISDRDQRKPGLWGDGWSVADLVAHLAAWQRMFLGWHAAGLRGEVPAMPAPGYKWNETPRLNRAMQKKHARRAPGESRSDFESGYRRILALASALSPTCLLTAGRFAWTGRNPLSTYLTANTASHYRFAIRVIERSGPAGPGSRAQRSPRRSNEFALVEKGARSCSLSISEFDLARSV